MSTTAVQTIPPTSGELHRRQVQKTVCDSHKVPAPIYRHAAPSAPWPWMNFDIDDAEVHPLPQSDDFEWGQYPQSLFRNWTSEQVNRCQMLTKCSDRELSAIYKIRVFNNGAFDKHVEKRIVRKDDPADLRACWDDLGKSPSSNVRVQAIFVEDMTLPVLQMLGTKYNIEPFFFASSVNWIPSRYQEDPKLEEDHITVVLPFIRTSKGNQQLSTRTEQSRIPNFTSVETPSYGEGDGSLPYTKKEYATDTQTPLSLPENKFLVQDLLSLHMVRKTTTSTIISYHPSLHATSAKRLRCLTHRTGDSVYWSNLFKRSGDPTFLFLAKLWYALYAWDEAFEVLFRYINVLEFKVLESSDLELTRELHRLRAYLSHYQQLLQDFLWSVEFIQDTPNPAMKAIPQAEREDSAKLLRAEADNLISEIKRLTRQRKMLSDRLQNAIHLSFATVNMRDNMGMQQLAKVTVMDSKALKQIAYFTVIFLPATLVSNAFSMNIKGIIPTHNNPKTDPTETLAHYIESVIGLTLLASWVAIALQKDSAFHQSDSTVFHRTLWPFYYVYGAISRAWRKSANRRSARGTSASSAPEEEQNQSHLDVTQSEPSNA